MMPTRYSVDLSFDKANINKELMKVSVTKGVPVTIMMSPVSSTRA